jgi:hypothetical protein
MHDHRKESRRRIVPRLLPIDTSFNPNERYLLEVELFEQIDNSIDNRFSKATTYQYSNWIVSMHYYISEAAIVIRIQAVLAQFQID